MTVKLDGTNGVLQNYDVQSPTTGFSYTFASGAQTLIITPAGTLATGTITMPASPADGMVITIESTQQITAITVAGNTGQSIVGAPTQLIPNQPVAFVYRLSNTTWYPTAGGAGRASALVSGTSVASTSGTNIDFTGIPSWAKRITVMFNGVSTSGTNVLMIQVGSGSFTTTGYLGTGSGLQSTGGSTNNSSGFLTTDIGNAAFVRHGFFTLCSFGGNVWVANGLFGLSNQATVQMCGGSIALAGTLDRVRITTVGGTDTFDAGSINILYE